VGSVCFALAFGAEASVPAVGVEGIAMAVGEPFDFGVPDVAVKEEGVWLVRLLCFAR